MNISEIIGDGTTLRKHPLKDGVILSSVGRSSWRAAMYSGSFSCHGSVGGGIETIGWSDRGARLR